jgi:deoxycytidylate deaminase
MNIYELKWSDMAFGSKKPLRELSATFIAPSRQISTARFTQLIKQYLSADNLVVACTDEPFITGFEDQPQFKTLQLSDIQNLVDKVNNSPSPNKITILYCKQSDLVPIYEKIKFKKVLLVNGSWKYSFHTRPEYYALVSKGINFEYISPFADEDEAKKYAMDFEQKKVTIKNGSKLSETEMMEIANRVATCSFDNGFQVGVSLGKKISAKYELITTSYNQVVPYQTFAWHFGAMREKHLSQPGDLTYYDTIHAEIALLLQAQQKGINLDETTLFINVLPCPTCARMLCKSNISEVVYSFDHSDGFAIALLEKSGKKVRRIVNDDDLLKNVGGGSNHAS